MKFLVLSLLVSTSAFAVGHEGTGGGGVVRNGQYLTFGSAKVKLRPETLATVPGLTLLKRFAQKGALPQIEAGKLMISFFPSSARRYYSIDSSDLDAAKKSELLKSYHDAIGGQVPIQDLVVFAVTAKNETFLLPEFFQLDEVQQAAILFHESLWVLNSLLTYFVVIDSEIRFEAYLRAHAGDMAYDADFFDILDRIFGSNTLSIYAAAIDDLKNNRLKKIITNQYISSSVIEPFLGLGELVGVPSQAGRERTSVLKKEEVAAHLIKMMDDFPQSNLFKALYNRLDALYFETNIDHRWGTSSNNSFYTRTQLLVNPWNPSTRFEVRSGSKSLGCFGASLDSRSTGYARTESTEFALCFEQP